MPHAAAPEQRTSGIMVDIVEYLRQGEDMFFRDGCVVYVADEAASEIERLRVALRDIAACKTTRSNATVARMARIAEAALPPEDT